MLLKCKARSWLLFGRLVNLYETPLIEKPNVCVVVFFLLLACEQSILCFICGADCTVLNYGHLCLGWSVDYYLSFCLPGSDFQKDKDKTQFLSHVGVSG